MNHKGADTNRSSRLLQDNENSDVFSVLGRRTISTTVGQIYECAPNERNWQKKCAGVVCFVKDNPKKSYYIRVVDLSQRCIVWEQELNYKLEYNIDAPQFHSFEANTCVIGLNFADREEANHFRLSIEDKLAVRQQRKMERRQTTTVGRTAAPPPPAFSSSNHGNANMGDNPQWKKLFDTIGVSQSNLEDEETSKFIYDFVESHGGIEKATLELDKSINQAPPPPPPSRSASRPPSRAPPRSSAPPPPPPSSRMPARSVPPPPYNNRGIPPPPSRAGPPLQSSSMRVPSIPLPRKVPPPPPGRLASGGGPPPPPSSMRAPMFGEGQPSSNSAPGLLSISPQWLKGAPPPPSCASVTSLGLGSAAPLPTHLAQERPMSMRQPSPCSPQVYSQQTQLTTAECSSTLEQLPTTTPSSGASDKEDAAAQAIEDLMMCKICLEHRRNVVFQCGHTCCRVCADKLALCHMCRQTISQRITLYD